MILADFIKCLSDVEKDYLLELLNRDNQERKDKYNKLLDDNANSIRSWCRNLLPEKIPTIISRHFTDKGLSLTYEYLDHLDCHELITIRNMGDKSIYLFLQVQSNVLEQSLKNKYCTLGTIM